MKIVKILGKIYSKDEVENNAKIVKKWFVIKQINNCTFEEKYYCIENVENIEKEYEKAMEKLDKEKREFYEEYMRENMKETFPIIKDVSSYHKIRPDDGVEYCIFY